MLDKILLVGDNALWHPVTHALGVTESVAAPPAQLANDRTLIVFDCRTARRGELTHPDSICQFALGIGKPVLLLSPSASQLEALAEAGGHWPKTPAEALVVARRVNRSGGIDTELSALGHPLGVTVSAPVSVARDPNADPCDCPADDGEAAIPSDPAALASFVTRLRRYAEKGGALSPMPQMPDGLKYFQVPMSWSSAFTFGGNDRGAVTYSHSIWGFLNQTQGPSSQYLVCEASTTVLPGKLDHNDDEDRGVVLTDVVTKMFVEDTAFSTVQQVPTNGNGSWSETLNLPISYIDPITGPQIWTYENSVSQSLDHWSVQPGPHNDNRTLGSEWQMMDPCRGGPLPSGFKDAFTDLALVRDMPTVSTNGAILKSVNVWNRPASAAASAFTCATAPSGARFWSSGCARWICSYMNCRTYGVEEGKKVGLDFSSLMP